jgi:ABC-type phosphate transport system substrate-binding protein
VPLTAGSIVLAYNPDPLPERLRLSRSVHVDIILGSVTRWNDSRVTALLQKWTTAAISEKTIGASATDCSRRISSTPRFLRRGPKREG